MVRRLVTVGLSVLAPLLAACGSGDDEASADPAAASGSPVVQADLERRRFESTEVTGQTLVDGTTVRLDFTDRILTADAGCNKLSAMYGLEGGELAWQETPAATFKACDDALTEQDNWLTSFFMDGVETTTDGSTVTMSDGETTLVLTETSGSGQ